MSDTVATLRAEIARLRADLCAARELVGDLVYLAWETESIVRTQSDFRKLPQVEKARAFLERTGANQTGGEPT